MTPYEILNVNENSSDDDIHRSWRRLSFKYHPDRNNNSSESTKKFQEVSNAYDKIKSKDLRTQYNYEKNFNMGHDMPDMQDIFEVLFSNLNDKCGRSQNMQNMQNMPNIKIYSTGSRFMNSDDLFESDIFSNIMTPLPINKTLNISMKQAYEGGSFPITITKELCYNNKITTEEETLYVNLPMGIDDKEIITIKDKGSCINNIKGDVKVLINIDNDENYIRQGLDLIYTKDISLKESLCGVHFDLQHINGKTYKITNDVGSIIKPNYLKTIPELGFARDIIKGSLIIKFNVIFPDNLDKDKIEKLKDIL